VVVYIWWRNGDVWWPVKMLEKGRKGGYVKIKNVENGRG
jgi:hypothetical protein